MNIPDDIDPDDTFDREYDNDGTLLHEYDDDGFDTQGENR